MNDEFEELVKKFNTLLAKRRKTEYELLYHYKKKGYSINTIIDVIDLFKKNNIINDEFYFKDFIEYRKNVKFESINEIKYKLYKKSDKRDLIKQVLNENYNYEEEYEIGLKKIQKKRIEGEKAIRYLKNHGFGNIMKLINKIKGNSYEF